MPAIKFRKFGDQLHVEAPTGSGIKEIYSPVYEKNGDFHLEVSGKVDFQEYIESHADSVDLALILKRCEVTGDYSALNRRTGQYIDVTDFPQSYAEFLNYRVKAEQDFAALAPEVREKFDNSIDKYMATAGSPEWLSALGIEVQPAAAPVKEPAQDVKEVSDNA